MTFRNLSILQKIGLVVFVMGLSSLVIAFVGARGISALESAIVSVGNKEEVAREAMDLRVDIIAISRMTYQLAAAPEKAADFGQETEKRAGEMLGRLTKIEAVADDAEDKLLNDIRITLNSYFDEIRAMIAVAADKGTDAGAVKAALDKALEAQKTVTATVKTYSTYSGDALAAARSEALNSSSVAMTILAAAAAACVLFGVGVSLVVARRGIVMPVRELTWTMSELADGKLDGNGTDVSRQDEIGEMARAVEVFRKNGIAMRTMKAQEAALHARSSDLQSNISVVVASAVAGDFTGRITKDYENDDLNRFASSVNELVSSVDQTVNEVRRVIAALADADLTQTMRGEFHGAFAELQTNVNQTMVTLRSTMQNVRTAASTINDNSAELSSAANDLSKRT